MHILPAALLAALALAAAPSLAAKPPARGEAAEAGGEAYREEGMALCVADLRIVTALTGEDLEGICGCALGRFMEGRANAALPPLGPGRFRGVMESELLACTVELRPDRAREVAGRGIAAPEMVFEPKPAPAGADARPAASEDGTPDLWAWLGGLALPAWLAALPAWAWIAIGFGLILLVGGLVRRRDGRRDLLGPPPWMRRGGVRPAPRRPDLPRPR
jgi:hypothetical protein